MRFTSEIHEDEACELVQNLIKIKSINPPGNTKDISLYISKWLRAIDIQATIYNVEHVTNVVAKVGKTGGKRLLWNGHIDTVPIDSAELWITDPFSGALSKGFVFGRGASDMKGGIASFLLGLKFLKKHEEILQGEVVLMCSGDEETGSQKGTVHYLEEIDSDYDAAVVSEPTNLRLEYGQRGLRWIEINVTGKSCHAGRPYAGKNAIEHAIKLATEIKKLQFKRKAEGFEVEYPSLSITKIHGGIKENVISDNCTITFDRRLIPGETEEIALKEIKQILDRSKEEGYKVRMDVINKGWDPYAISKEEQIFKTFEKAFIKVMNKEPEAQGKGGCTDASHIYKMNIPALIFGPGDPIFSHAANEKVGISEILKCAEICSIGAIDFLNTEI